MFLFILEGPVKSGKTTLLSNWINGREDVDGILAPVINGERCLLHISSLESHPLESPANKKDQVKIGRFTFSQKVFLWAQERLSTIDSLNINWLVIDEIGPLELQGYGFEPAITSLLRRYSQTEINILMVIREGLVEKVLDHYLIAEKNVRQFTFP